MRRIIPLLVITGILITSCGPKAERNPNTFVVSSIGDAEG